MVDAMSDTFDPQAFLAKIESIVKKDAPLLTVSRIEDDLYVVSFPGHNKQVWIKAADDGTKFRIYKSLVTTTKPAQLGQISPAGEGFLGEVLANYQDEVGRPQN